MIKLINVNKTFDLDHGTVHAVRNVNIEISQGQIYGIIGHSGAGKSTLVRCINLLERPTSGQVIIDGQDITSLTENELRLRRHKIGMIFQQFNLLSARTVYENVAFPLRYRNYSKDQIDQKVTDLLHLVGLSDQAKHYPAQLSGGQKQRVAIARALANDPDILLCDEATSALDPQTTQSILDLLKRLNEELGLTIVIITHEMHVVKSICHQVAVMQAGQVVEEGPVVEVFVNPRQAITKDFINTISNLSKVDTLLANDSSLLNLNSDQLLLRLDFQGQNTKEAIISELSRQFNVSASILLANVDVVQDTVIGSLIVILTGQDGDRRQAINYLGLEDIRVEVIKYGSTHATVHA